MSLTLRGSDLPEESIQIALLQWGTEKGEKLSPQGWIWVPDRRGARNLVVAGGSFDWKQLKVHIYRQGIKPSTKRVTLYIDRTSIGQGELGIDDVRLIPVEPTEYKKPAAPKAKPAPQRKDLAASTVKPSPPREKPTPKTIMKEPPSPAAPQTTDSKHGELLLLDRGDSLERWSLNLGTEFPGAAGELSVEEVDEHSVLKVAFDLSGGGRYVGAQCRAEIGKADTLVFDLLGAGRSYFTARVMDATGQMHHGGFHVSPGDWKNVTLPLTKEKFTAHWGGANDGKIHFPLRQVLIAASSTKGEQGAFWLRDLAVKTRDRSETWRIEVSTNQPGQVHFADGPGILLTVTVDNRLREAGNALLSIRVFDLDHNEIASRKVEMHFAAWQRQTTDLSVDTPGPGHFSVLVTIANGAGEETGEGTFGVVRRPQRFRQPDADSFFAMHVSDPEVAARLGVHFTRHFHFWRYTESHQGQYKHATEYVDACLAAGIDVMMCLDYREPSWLKPRARENGLPTNEALRCYADWVRDAVRAHPGVAVFEIQNEPNLELGRSRDLRLETGVEFYSQLVEIAAPIVRREAPHALIAGCSVSGGDYDDGFSFSRPVFERVGKFIDVYGAHPYASPRTFGPGLHPSWPADNREAEKHLAALELLSQYEHTRRMWIGEKGWAITATSPLAGDVSLSFAHCLAQSLVVARSTPGIEKYFWFLQQQKHGQEGGDYTLFRGDVSLQPMPGAIAYANVAWHLDHAEPVESLRMADDDVQVHVFRRSETDTAVAAIWSVDKPFIVNAKLSDGAQAFDLFGRNISTQNIRLTGAPVFIRTSGTDTNALLARIKGADLAPDAPFEVISASLSNVKTLRLGLVNRTVSTLPVWCRIGNQRKRMILPSVVEPVWIEIGLAEPVTRRGEELHVDLSAGRAEPVRILVNPDVLPVTPSP